jgi:ABC-type nitrate/sulfonate/bicarbonate transport system ATPase subunit
MRGLGVSLDQTVILAGVNLTVNAGEFIAIVGASGSGKTTLLNTMARFLPHTGELTAPSRIGVVFQDHAVFPWLTVRQNIAFGLDGLTVAVRERILTEMLGMIDLTGREDAYPAQLSGGQVQRIGIARALAPEPSVVYMDEPFASLDRLTRERMQTWTLSVCEARHKTVIFVTHDIEEALYLSDRVLVLQAGRVCADIPVPFPRPRASAVKLRQEFVALKQAVTTHMNGEGWDLAAEPAASVGGASCREML